jgi:hypothetical protein
MMPVLFDKRKTSAASALIVIAVPAKRPARES